MAENLTRRLPAELFLEVGLENALAVKVGEAVILHKVSTLKCALI